MYVCMYVWYAWNVCIRDMYAYLSMYVCKLGVHVCLVCMYVCMYVCRSFVYAYVPGFMYVCMYVCMCIYMLMEGC